MKTSQAIFYERCPVLFWPWLWLQFKLIDRWLAKHTPAGELGEILIHMGPRGTLTVSHVSDNISGAMSDRGEARFTTLTFESLTWAYYPEWMYSVALFIQGRRTPARTCAGISGAMAQAEITDALTPIP